MQRNNPGYEEFTCKNNESKEEESTMSRIEGAFCGAKLISDD